MRRIGILCALLAIGLLSATALPGATTANPTTRACGAVAGVPIHAHDISCPTARRIYKANTNDNLFPAGWSCSASLACCYRGEVGASSGNMWWKRTVYRPLASSVVLGGKIYGAPTGQGWGEAHPSFIYNGGDASGSIDDVTWSEWGGPVAHGRGRHPIFKPRGGYYRHAVVAQLKAIRIGRCEGRQAYMRLLIREPRRPGAPLGPWRSWAGPQTICEPYGSYFGR
jgi:hypothetical protein